MSSQRWSADFTYSYFTRVVQELKRNFEPRPLEAAPSALSGSAPVAFLRHDIDFCMDHAVRMARIEAAHDVVATYMILDTCPFYSLSDARVHESLIEIRDLGHEIALHFDWKTIDPSSTLPLEAHIEEACRTLEHVAGREIRTISFHRPIATYLRGPLMVGKRVNAYAADLMHWYLSDSTGFWREGEPLPMLSHAKQPILQLLIHPIFWGETTVPARDKLQQFFDAKTATMTPEQVATFDEHMANNISILRRGRGDERGPR